jgi:hypothetical protein
LEHDARGGVRYKDGDEFADMTSNRLADVICDVEKLRLRSV